ncbi:hypothetical protein N431DRAFT_433940 [Stipitochalara longipes BDJ]|nr:hypothetical protein N431DRAFT_433940 [Stipitochalara longipes BDJ]
MDPNIEQLTDERDTYEAQRDHYRDHCSSLQSQLAACQNQLQGKFQTSQCNIDPSIFNDESLERLREWRQCLDFVIEEVEEKMKMEEKSEEVSAKWEEERGEEEKGEKKQKKGKTRGFETELPFSPSNLADFLTKNHQLTQGRTQYPEPRPKNA